MFVCICVQTHMEDQPEQGRDPVSERDWAREHGQGPKAGRFTREPGVGAS